MTSYSIGTISTMMKNEAFVHEKLIKGDWHQYVPFCFFYSSSLARGLCTGHGDMSPDARMDFLDG